MSRTGDPAIQLQRISYCLAKNIGVDTGVSMPAYVYGRCRTYERVAEDHRKRISFRFRAGKGLKQVGNESLVSIEAADRQESGCGCLRAAKPSADSLWLYIPAPKGRERQPHVLVNVVPIQQNIWSAISRIR